MSSENNGKIRACWCSLESASVCEACERKVYYPDQVLTDEPVQFFEADEEDCYWV